MHDDTTQSDSQAGEWFLRRICRRLAEELLAEHEAKKRNDDMAGAHRPEPAAEDAEKGAAG